MSIFVRLQNIDRRILYVLIAAVIIVPLVLKPSRHPSVIFPEVSNAFEVIDRVPADKYVIISDVWGPGTEAENAPQTEILMRHMFQRNTKFVVVSWDQAGSDMVYAIGDRLSKEMGKKYGVDWAHMGYRPLYPAQVVLRGLALNFKKVMDYDRFRTPSNNIPVLDALKDHKNVGAVIEITPSGTVDYWIAYFTGPYKVPLVFCPTAVMAAEAYPYLDSGQIKGMLNGVIGAVQYEKLLGMGNVPTDATRMSWALSSAHIFIILLIVLGNLGYLASRRRGNGRGTQ